MPNADCSLLNRSCRKFQIHSQRIGEAVGQIHQAHQKIEFNNLAIVEVRFEDGDVAVIDIVRRARKFFGKDQCGFFFFGKRRRRWIFEGFPIVGCKAGSLRRSEVVLQSIVALVDHGNADVDQLVQPALHVAANAGIEGEKVLKYVRAVGQGFLYATRLAFQNSVVNFFYFRWCLVGFDVADAGHDVSSSESKIRCRYNKTYGALHLGFLECIRSLFPDQVEVLTQWVTQMRVLLTIALLCLAQLSIAAAKKPRKITENELWKEIVKTSGCESLGAYIQNVIYYDFTGDGEDEAVVDAGTCNTGTAGPDVHSVFSRNSKGHLIELKIAEIDPKNYDALFGNRNLRLSVQQGLLVETFYDGTSRKKPLVVKYKWNGKKFLPVSIQKSPRYKTSYDCDKAQQEVERATCYDPALAKLDVELNRVYQSLLKKLSPAEKEDLRAEERKWLADRDKRCTLYKDPTVPQECYESRIDELEKRLPLMK
ncbi:MAG TPA: lysozyme inhibitor LprI family protein [Terriglobales bacterium]|jgi:uncharacterized protein YecT (DUF1311 family)|nr:lysozyme inhibitor LprI family protein [Terriglobales bacterium]